MRLRHILIKVDDQDKALAFYTSVMGFVKKHDHDSGPIRWLTVVAPDDGGTELVLEPNSAPPARAAQQALYDARSRRRSSPSATSTPSSTGSPRAA
ncbi:MULTISPECIES: VOC family protein [unclassified Mesorhizobium]|uniref:VOC family protein n=1 Tax=unclassified Mesorhizobium TaxID=325217 RepID=UPI00247B140A|nr:MULTISPECIES: VOC family protein [unclassified Mesorhizobium]